MDIDVLGTLAIRERGVSVTPTAPKPRQVLALLALHAGQVVPVAVLAEELWGSRPPRSARPTLQTYILQLRELITVALRHAPAPAGVAAPAALAAPAAPAGGVASAGGVAPAASAVSAGVAGGGGGVGVSAKEVLLTVPGGYLLKGGEGTSDVREFERLAGSGYRAMDAEDYPRAARLLREALALWSGPALADVHTGPHLQTEVRRLEESRLCALDQRVEADLRLGRHRELLAELTVLVDQYPTHESLCGQFMLALYRSGRRGEALDAYQRMRATLVRTMGLEPSAALGKLQRSILMSGPGLLPAARAAGASPAPVG
ncbi:BTAD domain-containing putative transcriptional regulator [Streptomyces sp. NPDC101225]|uniref:AfsR/SARP family transcriptional regulator n=1 Tax=Streptomyces sp. NPDC101225 TaxID=3366135 RepID=UPI00380AB818